MKLIDELFNFLMLSIDTTTALRSPLANRRKREHSQSHSCMPDTPKPAIYNGPYEHKFQFDDAVLHNQHTVKFNQQALINKKYCAIHRRVQNPLPYRIHFLQSFLSTLLFSKKTIVYTFLNGLLYPIFLLSLRFLRMLIS